MLLLLFPPCLLFSNTCTTKYTSICSFIRPSLFHQQRIYLNSLPSTWKCENASPTHRTSQIAHRTLSFVCCSNRKSKVLYMLSRRFDVMAILTVRTDFEPCARLMPCHIDEGTLAFAELSGPPRSSQSLELEKHRLYLPLTSKPSSTHIPSLQD